MEAPSFDLDLAKKLPSKIRFGTSTWTYPGWKGIIYHREYKSDKAFRADSLAEYASFPLFRTVGIDSTFYRPPTEKQLINYAEQVPKNFQWLSKVWEDITAPVFPKHPRYGARKGQKNPNFLNPEIFEEAVLEPYRASKTESHQGPFIFQFPTFAKATLESIDFLASLHSFLEKLPKDFRYATELRTPKLLGKPYFDILNEFGATHCFNHWNYMPDLAEQMKAAASAGGLSADFFVARLLTPLGTNYSEAVERFKPYDKMQLPNEKMRKDAAQIARRAIKRNIPAFIIVNNRAEGHAPLTIDAIGRLIV